MTGVLLMAYGGPDTLDDVEPYLRDVRGGRPMTPAFVEEVRARYARIGGGSPLLQHTRAQASSLQRALGDQYDVRVGMRHWHPYIGEVLAKMERDGLHRVRAIPMSPYDSRLSVGAYADKLREVGSSMAIEMARSWHLQPEFLDAVVARVRAAYQPGDAVIFTAHSLPARILTEGDPYPDQLNETCEAVAQRCGLEGWDFAYQSPGRTGETWLGPFIDDALQFHMGGGVLVVPIGFICDHVEILYDIDVVLMDLAATLGIRLRRTESLNDDPGLVAALASIARGDDPTVQYERV